jgi:hypothetical protein
MGRASDCSPCTKHCNYVQEKLGSHGLIRAPIDPQSQEGIEDQQQGKKLYYK